MTQAWSRGEAISRQHIWTGRDRQSELSDEAKELSNVTPRLRRGGRISSRSPCPRVVGPFIAASSPFCKPVTHSNEDQAAQTPGQSLTRKATIRGADHSALLRRGWVPDGQKPTTRFALDRSC